MSSYAGEILQSRSELTISEMVKQTVNKLEYEKEQTEIELELANKDKNKTYGQLEEVRKEVSEFHTAIGSARVVAIEEVQKMNNEIDRLEGLNKSFYSKIIDLQAENISSMSKIESLLFENDEFRLQMENNDQFVSNNDCDSASLNIDRACVYDNEMLLERSLNEAHYQNSILHLNLEELNVKIDSTGKAKNLGRHYSLIDEIVAKLSNRDNNSELSIEGYAVDRTIKTV